MPENTLYYGDNLYWLRRMKDETVDLIYLDPPFNSNRSYNVLFKDEKGTESQAQIMAFEDTWHWNRATEEAYDEIVSEAPSNVVHLIAALRESIGTNQMMAYLVMMTIRLVELHRVLKPTGSLYLHCDPTASHYLKLILDTIFGPEHFTNEIIWQRSLPHGNTSKKFGASHDTLLFYKKGEEATWNGSFVPHRKEYLEQFYRFTEPDGRRYRLISCINPNPDRPNLTYEWKGVTRVWKYTRERMQKMDEAGLLVYSKNGVPSYKGYLDAMQGTPTQDVWTDIPPLMGSSDERLGYPTQKPIALLERIVQASSNTGDVVLDPFCGCGTAITAAHKLGRKWIGIDITHLSIALMKYRLEAMFPGIQIKMEGEPKDMGAARKLAHDDRYQFQFWALSLIRAKPLGGQVGSREGKKGSDKGIDGIIDFYDDTGSTPKKIIVQVKSGHVKSGDIRDLIGTVQREKAEMGVFLTLEEPTRDMRTEAATAGTYTSPWGKHPKIQIFTIEELLIGGKKVDMPPQLQTSTFKKAAKTTQTIGTQLSLLDELAVTDDAVLKAISATDEEDLEDGFEDEEEA